MHSTSTSTLLKNVIMESRSGCSRVINIKLQKGKLKTQEISQPEMLLTYYFRGFLPLENTVTVPYLSMIVLKSYKCI